MAAIEGDSTCRTTFFKDEQLDYTYVTLVLDLANASDMVQYPARQNVEMFDCVVCRLILRSVQAKCGEFRNKELIESALSEVCSTIASPFQHNCNDMIYHHFYELADLFMEYGNDEVACHKLILSGTLYTNTSENDAENTDESIDTSMFQETNVEIGECLVCKAIVKVVKEVVKHSFTRDKVKRALSKACQKVHSNKCQNFLNKHFNQLVDLISNASTRGRVCNIIRVCLADSLNENLVDDIEQLDFVSIGYDYDFEMSSYQEQVGKKKRDCAICKAVVATAKALIKTDFSRDKVKQALTKVCGKLHKFGFKCQHFVDQYMDKLIDLLLNAATRNRVCGILKLCSTPTSTSSSSSKEDNINKFSLEETDQDVDISGFQESNVEIGECFVCKAIVKVVKEVVKHSFTRDKVKHALSKACQKVHSRKCQNFVNKHFNQLVDLISNASTRGRVCNIIRVCLADILVQEQQLDLMSIDHDYDVEMSSYQEQVDKKKRDCAICKAVEGTAKALIKTDFSRDKVKQALTKVCGKLHKFGSKCQHFVDQYMGKLIDLLLNAATRNRVCGILKLCSMPMSTSSSSNDDNIDKFSLEESKQNSDSNESNVEIGECFVCKAIVKVVKEVVKHSFTRDKVKHALSKACQKVHSNKCQNFLNKHFNQLVDLISNASTRGRVCNIIRVCLADSLIHEQVEDIEQLDFVSIYHDFDFEMSSYQEQVDKKKRDCAICKAVVATAKALIKTDFSRDKVKQALTKVCGKLHKFGSKCQHFVDQYMGKLIDLLLNAATRNRVCGILKLCSMPMSTSSSSNDDNIDKFSLEEPKQNSDTNESNVEIGECFVCKAIVKVVKEVVKHSFTRDKVKHALSKACQKVHSNKCQNFLNKYFNQLVDLISNASTRGRVCNIIRVCLADSLIHEQVEDIEQLDFVSIDHDYNSEMSSYQEQVDKKKRDCAICKAVVATAKALIKTDFSRDKVKQALTKVCGKLHKFGSKCQHFVDQYMGKLIDLLLNAATRNRVCGILKLCSMPMSTSSSSNEDNIDKFYLEESNQNSDISYFAETKESNVEIGECFVCKAIVKVVKEVVKHSFTRDKVQHALSKACQKVHSNKCQNFVNKHFNQLVDLISNASTRGRVCNIIRVCLADSLIQEPVEDIERLDFVSIDHDFDFEMSSYQEQVDKKKRDCAICKAVVATAKALIKTDFSRDKVKQALTKVCSKLHKFGSKCQHFVDQYMGNLIDLLLNAATRNRVCGILKLCSTPISPSLSSNDDNIDKISLEEADQGNEFDISSSQEQVDKKKRDCAICKAVVTTAKALIKTDFSRDKVKQALTKVCSKLHKFGSKCQHFVDQYMGKLIDLLLNAATRNRVCGILKLCSMPISTSLSSNDDNIDKFSQEEINQNIDISDFSKTNNVEIGECFICKAVVKIVKETLKHSYTRDKIKHALSKACHKVHSHKCQRFINNHFNQLIDLILKASTRGRVCNIIRVCLPDDLSEDQVDDNDQLDYVSINDFEMSSYQEQVDKKKPDCAICKAVVATAKGLIKTDFSRDKVKQALTKVCGKLHKFGSKCQHFVDQYMDKLIDLLLNAATRNRVCRLLKLCSSEDSFPVIFETTYRNSGSYGSDICQTCQFVTGMIQVMIHDDKMTARIHDHIERVCNMTPEPIRDMCNNELKTHWVNWIKVLRSFKMTGVCYITKMCGAQSDVSTEYNVEIGLCGSCYFAMDIVKDVARNDFFMNKVNKFLIFLCNLIPQPLGHICDSEIKIYWDEWRRFIQTLNNQEICHAMWLCDALQNGSSANLFVSMNIN